MGTRPEVEAFGDAANVLVAHLAGLHMWVITAANSRRYMPKLGVFLRWAYPIKHLGYHFCCEHNKPGQILHGQMARVWHVRMSDGALGNSTHRI